MNLPNQLKRFENCKDCRRIISYISDNTWLGSNTRSNILFLNKKKFLNKSLQFVFEILQVAAEESDLESFSTDYCARKLFHGHLETISNLQRWFKENCPQRQLC